MTKPVSVIKTAQKTGLKGERLAPATKPATAPEATPVVEPTSGAETGASAKEQAQDAQRVQGFRPFCQARFGSNC